MSEHTMTREFLREYQNSLIEKYGFCASCLGNLNHTLAYRAIWKASDGTTLQHMCETPVGTSLLKWAIEHYYGIQNVIFENGASNLVLIPVAVFMGTPLCEPCNMTWGIHSRASLVKLR